MSLSLTSLLLVLLFSGQAAHAGVYRWVDADGKVHYSDKPPEQVVAKPVAIAPPPSSATVTPPTVPGSSSSGSQLKQKESWHTRFSRAIEQDDEPAAVALLHSPDADEVYSEDLTAAIRRGHLRLYQAVYDKRERQPAGLFVNMQLYLHTAIMSGQLELYRAMLAHGFVLREGDNILRQCVDKRLHQSVAALVEDGANPDVDNGALLRLAVERKDARMVELLLRLGSNPNHPPGANYDPAKSHLDPGYFQTPALWKAVYSNQFEAAKTLLEHGADPNMADVLMDYQETPLDLAEREKKAEMVTLLLAHQAKNGPKGRERKRQEALSNRATEYQRSLGKDKSQ